MKWNLTAMILLGLLIAVSPGLRMLGSTLGGAALIVVGFVLLAVAALIVQQIIIETAKPVRRLMAAALHWSRRTR